MPSKLNSTLIRLSFLLIFIGATSVAYLLLPDNKITRSAPTQYDKPVVETTTSSLLKTNKQPEIIKIATPPQPTAKPDIPAPTTTNPSPSSTTEYLTEAASLTVNDQNYILQFNTGENMLTAMRRLDETNADFQFSGKEYTGLGFFVKEINGAKNNPNANEYWGYYINGQSAMVGISNYLLKSGDKIKWQYGKPL